MLVSEGTMLDNAEEERWLAIEAEQTVNGFYSFLLYAKDFGESDLADLGIAYYLVVLP